MLAHLWFRPVASAFLVGGVLTALSCGGGGAPSFVGPVCSPTFVSPNYAEEVDPDTGDQNSLWWWRGFPVKVWIDPATAHVFDPTGENVFSTDTIMTGINRWPAATSNGVRITIVASQSDADIQITMKEISGASIILGATAVTFLQATFEIVAAEISISWWPGMTVEQFRDGMVATVAHEMGHALYLGGHSLTNTDLMFKSNDSSFDKAISIPDENTIQTTYCGNFQTRGRGFGEGPLVTVTIECPADDS